MVRALAKEVEVLKQMLVGTEGVESIETDRTPHEQDLLDIDETIDETPDESE